MGVPRRGAFLALGVLLTLSGAAAQKSKPCAPWCPARSTCVNGTACRCEAGFTSTSGEIFTERTDMCEDINECAPPRSLSCGKFADCQNVDGSYYCTCSPGYGLLSGEKVFKDESQNTCQDVNECTSGQNPCHSSTHCMNKAGGYQCLCRPGWRPIPGAPNGPNSTVCEDVDECSSGQHQCHNSTVCVNTQGSYKCRCRQGWKPIAGSLNGPINTTCEEIHLPTWTPPHGVHSQSLSGFLDKVQALSRDFKPALANVTIQRLIQSVDDLLKAPGDLERLALSDQHLVATQLLSDLEQSMRTLARTLPTGPFTYRSPSGTELSLMVQEKGTGNVTMGQSHARMLLDWAVASEDGDLGHPVAGILSSPNMQQLLANASLELTPEKQADLEDTYEGPVRGARLRLLSAVSSVFLSNTRTHELGSPVTFAFSHPSETPRGPRQEVVCAFWKSESRGTGRWATEGCRKLGSQNGSTTCQCTHLSSFAVLMAHYDVQDPQLTFITKVGLALSLVCLLLCILTFLLVRPIQGSRTTVHLHLCVCLFVGSAVFLAGIENEGGQVGLRCRLVAALLHYCFLAAFCWMSLEGLELYFLVVRVFQGQGLRARWLCLLGYGVPLAIVGISAAVRSQGYGRAAYCWLDPAGGFLWSFLGPVTVIVLCNAIIFVTTVWRLAQKFSDINPDMKKLRKARVLTVTAVAQLVVLGCTWVFGLFLFDPRSWLLSYVFTVLNCLQGAFLYVLHCLLNKKVREEYRKWACLVAGNRYSEFVSSSTGSSHQPSTRVLRPSESGM
ncbi:adhesion G protein-coupled receptor E5 isoform X1 [Oryctolagus cuniculus]|uniref:adhesion G protein-coupled receptor E5 isoform X1 n=2 Tax=Oryctolagus cuniculus TaxID=9986 RepID=UPI00387A360A